MAANFADAVDDALDATKRALWGDNYDQQLSAERIAEHVRHGPHPRMERGPDDELYGELDERYPLLDPDNYGEDAPSRLMVARDNWNSDPSPFTLMFLDCVNCGRRGSYYGRESDAPKREGFRCDRCGTSDSNDENSRETRQ